MGQGIHSHIRDCPYQPGKRYRLTNFMVRRRTHGWNAELGQWWNAHTIACKAGRKVTHI